jgi:hypothetical protein
MELEAVHLLRGSPLALHGKDATSNNAPAVTVSPATTKKWPPPANGFCGSSLLKSHALPQRRTRFLSPRCSAFDVADARAAAFKDRVDFLKGGGSEIDFVQMQAVKELRQPRIKDQVR